MNILECKNICHKNYRGKVRKVIDSQIEKFFEIENSDFKLPSHTYKMGDTVTLNTHHYLHAQVKMRMLYNLYQNMAL